MVCAAKEILICGFLLIKKTKNGWIDLKDYRGLIQNRKQENLTYHVLLPTSYFLLLTSNFLLPTSYFLILTLRLSCSHLKLITGIPLIEIWDQGGNHRIRFDRRIQKLSLNHSNAKSDKDRGQSHKDGVLYHPAYQT